MAPVRGKPRPRQTRLRLSRNYHARILMLGWLAWPTGLLGAERVERRLVAMGTVFDLRVAGPDRAVALAASEAAVREVERVEALLSTWKRGGPLDRLNLAPAGQMIEIGDETERLLEEIWSWSARTEGAFDPTVLPLVRTWDLRGVGRIPKPMERARALAAVGPRNFLLDPTRGAAARVVAEAGIDEGAWGKGYALDRAAAAAERAGGTDAVLDLGGQILVRGRLTVAIADPRDRDRAVASLTLEQGSISTSGNSQRGRTVAGRRIGHLLDPRTGNPAPDFGSATAIAPSALVADILSTAFFVLGPEKGLNLSESLRRQGFANEVFFLVAHKERLTPVASPSLCYTLEEKP